MVCNQTTMMHEHLYIIDSEGNVRDIKTQDQGLYAWEPSQRNPRNHMGL
jgi:hypothetical protein